MKNTPKILIMKSPKATANQSFLTNRNANPLEQAQPQQY